MIWFILACAPPPETCATDAEPEALVVREILLGRIEDGVSEGFDLDGVVSEEDGATGCGVGDTVTPEGVPGVDNALARLIPLLELTEAVAVEGLIQNSIN